MTTLDQLIVRRRKLRNRLDALSVEINNMRAVQAVAVPVLYRPDGQDPDTFYKQVADAYRTMRMSTHYPGQKLADVAQVPVTTMHRWIYEARRRGHLEPPRKKGAAG